MCILRSLQLPFLDSRSLLSIRKSSIAPLERHLRALYIESRVPEKKDITRGSVEPPAAYPVLDQ